METLIYGDLIDLLHERFPHDDDAVSYALLKYIEEGGEASDIQEPFRWCCRVIRNHRINLEERKIIPAYNQYPIQTDGRQLQRAIAIQNLERLDSEVIKDELGILTSVSERTLRRRRRKIREGGVT